MNILINDTVSHSMECMDMKSLHYFYENCSFSFKRNHDRQDTQRTKSNKEQKQQMISKYTVYMHDYTYTIPSVGFKIHYYPKMNCIGYKQAHLFKKDFFFYIFIFY